MLIVNCNYPILLITSSTPLWLFPLSRFQCVTMQEVMSNHWIEHGKHAFHTFLQKVTCIFFVVLFIYEPKR